MNLGSGFSLHEKSSSWVHLSNFSFNLNQVVAEPNHPPMWATYEGEERCNLVSHEQRVVSAVRAKKAATPGSPRIVGVGQR